MSTVCQYCGRRSEKLNGCFYIFISAGEISLQDISVDLNQLRGTQAVGKRDVTDLESFIDSLDLDPNGPLTRYLKLQVAHAPGMPGTFPPAADFKQNRKLAIPTCITARA